MNCSADISKIILNKQNITLNFKEQEMKGDNNNIYFIGLNDIEIINLLDEKKWENRKNGFMKLNQFILCIIQKEKKFKYHMD